MHPGLASLLPLSLFPQGQGCLCLQIFHISWCFFFLEPPTVMQCDVPTGPTPDVEIWQIAKASDHN